MVKLKIDREEDVQEGEIVDTAWDFKKIAIGLVVLVVIFIAGSYVLLPMSDAPKRPEILGVSTNLSPTPPLPKKEDVQKLIMSAKEALSNITSENLTSSQAAIQTVISDLQELQGKSGAMGLLCKQICGK